MGTEARPHVCSACGLTEHITPYEAGVLGWHFADGEWFCRNCDAPPDGDSRSDDECPE